MKHSNETVDRLDERKLYSSISHSTNRVSHFSLSVDARAGTCAYLRLPDLQRVMSKMAPRLAGYTMTLTRQVTCSITTEQRSYLELWCYEYTSAFVSHLSPDANLISSMGFLSWHPPITTAGRFSLKICTFASLTALTTKNNSWMIRPSHWIDG
jgi:hypothetical protein